MRQWVGSIYWSSEDNETEHHFIANFNVEAKMRRDAMKLILERHWGTRFQGLHPVFKWGQVIASVRTEVSNAEAIAISDRLGKILQTTCVLPATTSVSALYEGALRDVEAEFGVGSVILALRQVVGFLQRELDYHTKADQHIEDLLSLADGQDTMLKDAADYLRGLRRPIQVRAGVQVTDEVASLFDHLKLQPKTETEVAGHTCSICDEVIIDGEAAVRDGSDFAHLNCSVQQSDGDDIDRDHGAS
jgi:hypothetical protein